MRRWYPFELNVYRSDFLPSINDLPIKESERKYHWPLGRRPDGHTGLSDLGL